MILRFIYAILLGVGMICMPGLDGHIGTMAVAMGGDGGATDDNTKTTTAPKKPATAPKKNGKSTTKKSVPVHADYKQSKIRAVRDTQSKIAGYAKKDKLKGLATNGKRLENFVDQVTEMGDGYSGWKSVEFNLIFVQLKRYANQKKDKALRKWAKAILTAFDVIHKRDIAEEKRQKVKKAIKDKNPMQEAFGRAEYSDARGDYHRAAKKLPPETRKQFTPLPKDPAK
ncbi:hypothetical protein RXV86_09150 [Alisedimentitalea sp. MJ-SS2]|uniref:hypothetical protein n=1 Tax=Aliisedimentitalea sp. MJ-SS2 TaxID=3049795 RepID=UPI002911D422|nr:hypothetical protein [Alisedimentitalea sp. MJ-SS2]MDU8927549.1 hypothetical protein [Alisedimentitalea sp. MJ-SS2]